MSTIVATYAVPHTPSFVADVNQNGALSETFGHFRRMREHLEEAAPDVIVTINNDHFNTFFLDAWPTFAIGLARSTSGPNDQTPGMPRYTVPVAKDLSSHLLRSLATNGFDFTWTEEFEVDHGVLVPLHFMTPAMAIPIVPIFINCVVPPLPSARRCHYLGGVLRDAIESWTGPSRIAVVASGSLSLEIGGPRVFEGKTFGVPDPSWASWAVDRVRAREHEALIEAASESRMLEAGNVAGELLNWIAALGLVGDAAPDILIEQPELGNAFAAWGPSSES